MQTPLSNLFVLEGSVRVRFAQLQTRLIQTLRTLEPGEVLDRASLMEKLWGPSCPNPNRLDQLVWAVNRKRPDLVLFSPDRGGWYLSPVAKFGEYASVARKPKTS